MARAIHIEKNRVLSAEELDKILIDATEIQTQRPTKKQRKYYSGKKKKHTQKIRPIAKRIFGCESHCKNKLPGLNCFYYENLRLWIPEIMLNLI